MPVMSTSDGITPYPNISGARMGGKTKDIALLPQEETSMKCSTCGLAKDENPAHADNYIGHGKHKFAGASSKSLLEDDSPIFFGSAVKALGDGRVGGFGIIFTTDQDPDVTNDFFDSETDFFLDGETKAVRPILYDHGLDATLKSRKLGRGTVEIKDAGVWVEGQLNLRDDYEKAIYKMAEEGKLGWSTGSAPHLITREAVGKSQHIKSWPIVEMSLTPMPVEPRTRAVALKSYAEDRVDLLSEVKAEIDDVDDDEEDDDTPHEFEASDDDAELCDDCGENFQEGNHASAKALAWMKGGPGSGRYPKGSGDDGEGGAKHSTRQYRVSPQYSPHGKLEAYKVERHSPREGQPDRWISTQTSLTKEDAERIAAGKNKGKNPTRFKKSDDRPVKSLFEEKIAQRTQSVYELDRARDEVFRDIISAEKTSGVTGVHIDKRQKVTETVTEYAARLIILVLEQMQKFEDGEYDTSMSSPVGGQTQFYLRSFDGENPLQSFLSIKSMLVSGSRLDEHSSQVVSALDEYAAESASLLEGIKSWIERCEGKIQFRAGDSTKSGRTISRATLSKLDEARKKLAEALASGNELDGHINGLIELAVPKKAIDIENLLALAIAEHENEMAGVPSSVH